VAVLLLANLLVMLGRSSSPWESIALGQRQAPIAGGAGIFVMPAQLSASQWGCYLLDVDNGTLCVYQFQPPGSQLKFLAARDIKADRLLRNYNTAPPPEEIRELYDKLKASRADQPGDAQHTPGVAP
jgi:hypothetical protein